jgi:hypothetical protein
MTMETNSDEEVAKKIGKRLKEIATKYGCTVFVINHTMKGSNERTYGPYSMSGSRIYMQEADFMIGINRTSDNTRYVKLVFSRYDKDDYETVDTFILDENLSIEIVGQDKEAKILACYDRRHDSANTEAVHAEIRKVVEETGTNDFETGQIKHLYESGQMSKQTFYDALKDLREAEMVKVLSKKKYQYLNT